MRRNSRIILAAAFGLLIHLCGDALAGPAREGASVRRNQAATPGGAVKPGGPTASSPFVVVIDPGHGGGDSGSRGAQLLEKDFALRAAGMLAALLSRRPEVKAILTREADSEMTAVQRASVANYNSASLFITLHADASWRPGARGPVILVAAPRRPPRVEGEAPQAVAFRWQRSQNVHLASNRRFALSLQRRFAALRPGEKPPLHILAVRDLEGARMPAAYVSLGVISTPEDEARLREIKEEDPYVVALAKEVLRFAGLSEDLPPKPPAPPSGAAPAESLESRESPGPPGAPETGVAPSGPQESEAAPAESPRPDASAPDAQNAAPAGVGR